MSRKKFKEFVSRYTFPEYSFLPAINRNAAASILLKHAAGSSKNTILLHSPHKGGASCWLLARKQMWLGRQLNKIVWMTRFLIDPALSQEKRRRASRLLLSDFKKKITPGAGIFSYVNTQEIGLTEAHQQANFRLVTTHLTYLAVTPPGSKNTGASDFSKEYAKMFRFRLGKKKDLEAFSNLNALRFEWDQYHLDPDIPPKKADLIFKRWVTESFTKRPHTALGVVEQNGTPVAFSITRKDVELSRISKKIILRGELQFALPTAFGANIFLRAAAAKVFRGSQNRSCIQLTTVPIGNTRSQNMVQRSAKLKYSHYIFHYWKTQ